MLTGLPAYNELVGRAYRLMIISIGTLNVLTGYPAYKKHVQRAYGLTDLESANLLTMSTSDVLTGL